MKSHIRYSMDGNGKELEQVVYTRWTSYRSEPEPEPERVQFTKSQSSLLLPFTFVSVGSSPHSYMYLFISALVRIPVHA